MFNFNYKFNDSNTQLVITPKSKMDKKTDYLLEVKLKHNYLDFSEEMLKNAKSKSEKHFSNKIELLEKDILQNNLLNNDFLSSPCP